MENTSATMRAPKEIPDKEIMQGIIDALRIKPTELAEKLGYGSHMTVYNVLKGESNISRKMEDKLMEHFPDINVLYLKKGKGEPLRTGRPAQNQGFIGMKFNDVPSGTLDEIRLRLSTIERDGLENKKLLQRILDILEKK